MGTQFSSNNLNTSFLECALTSITIHINMDVSIVHECAYFVKDSANGRAGTTH